MITQERKLAEVTININDDPITQDQREQIAHGIGEIRRFLIEARDLFSLATNAFADVFTRLLP